MIMKSQWILKSAFRYLDAKNIRKLRVISWGSHYVTIESLWRWKWSSQLNKKPKLVEEEPEKNSGLNGIWILTFAMTKCSALSIEPINNRWVWGRCLMMQKEAKFNQKQISTKFHFVKFWKTNSIMCKYRQSAFIWMVTS